MYKVHGMTLSGNCYKLKLALTQLGEPYEWVEVDVLGGATRAPEFRLLNPNGKVPVLELPNGAKLPESNAALCYLAEGSRLLPEERLDRARVLQWMFFEQYTHEPAIAVARFIARFAGNKPEQQERLADCRKRGAHALAVMEDHLVDHRWFAAGRYTVADIALYAYTHCAPDGGIELEPYPAVRAWLKRVEATPGFVPMGA